MPRDTRRLAEAIRTRDLAGSRRGSSSLRRQQLEGKNRPVNKILVTGGTGLVGFQIVAALRRRGADIRCLVRSPEKAQSILGDVEIVQGDLLDADSIREATRGCSSIYHAAGLPEQWLSDRSIYQRLNVEGTRRMIAAALEHGVEKFVFTSTVDVFVGEADKDFDESIIDPDPKGTAYERSKQQADRLVAEALERGLPAVFIHPSAVYGPGPATSRGLNHFFADLRDGKIPLLLPGGLPVVYGPDVGEGHVLAAEQAEAGSRFILSDAYLSLADMAHGVAEVVGLKKTPPVLPLWVGKMVSEVGERISKLTHKPPLIPRGQLHLLQWGAIPVAERAKEELGWRMTPFAEGVRETMEFLERDAAPPARDD